MKAINFKKFEVVSSDCGESYVWVRREFPTAKEGIKFKDQLMKAMEMQAEKNVFKLVCNVDEIPFAYIPLIKITADDYYENPYDEDGQPLESCEPEYKEQYVAIYNLFVTQSAYYRGPNAPCIVNVKMTIGISAAEFEDKLKATEVTINSYECCE